MDDEIFDGNLVGFEEAYFDFLKHFFKQVKLKVLTPFNAPCSCTWFRIWSFKHSSLALWVIWWLVVVFFLISKVRVAVNSFFFLWVGNWVRVGNFSNYHQPAQQSDCSGCLSSHTSDSGTLSDIININSSPQMMI